MISKSLSKQQEKMAFLYLSSLYSSPNKMLSRTVALVIQALKKYIVKEIKN